MAADQTIASLIVKLSTNVVDLQTGLKKAEGQIQSFLGGISSMMTKLAAGLTAGLGVQQFIGAITGAREFAAEMSRTAEKVGVPVELLSVLADAADKAGVSSQSLAQGLKFLSRNMFEASQGTGAAKAIFDELGVSFKNADGTLRPVQDVLLDLVGKFSAMEDGAGKTAIALKFFGRAGQEMVPFMNLGTESIAEFIKSAQQMGLQIDSDTGKKARALGIAFKEIGDAIKGLTIGIMSAFLPSMQSGADSTLNLAERINSLRLRLTEIGEALRYVAAVALPLVVVQIASVIAGATSLGWAIQNVGFILQYFATVTLGPMLLNPLTWIAAALVGLSVLWTKLGEGTRAAARDHMAYVAAVSSMKPEDLQKNLVAMTDYLSMIQQKIAEARKEIGEATPSLAQGAALDALLKYEAEAKARIAAIQKLQDAVTKPKTPAPFVADPKILKELQDKAHQLGAEFLAFQDPVAGASAAIEEFIRKTVGDTPKLGAIAKAANDVRAAFQTLFKAQQERANVAAAEKGTFAMSVAGWEAYGQDLQRQFENGLVDIKSYYEQRRNLINAQAAAEILLLQTEKGRKETTPARRIEIDAEISVKGIKQDASIKKDLADEVVAWRTLGETSLDFDQRLAEAQGRVLDGKRAALALEMQTYETGLKGRGVSAEDAKKQAADLFAAKTNEINFNEQIRQFGIAQADLDIRKQKVNDDLAVGIGDQFTAEEKIVAMEKDRIPILQKMADEAMRLANESGRPELIQQAAGMNAAVRQLSIGTDEAGRNMATLKKGAQDALVDGFANFLSRGITEAKNFGEAVRNMAAGFAQAMATMLARMIAFKAVSAMFQALGIDMPAMKDGGPVQSKAEGGHVRGPGTGTSDSILARLSNWEYVVNAKAVRHYGISTLEAINRMILPKGAFAGTGGMMPHSPGFAFAGGGLVSGRETENIQVKVINESGVPMVAKNAQASIDPQGMIVTLWLDALDRNRFGLRSKLGG